MPPELESGLLSVQALVAPSVQACPTYVGPNLLNEHFAKIAAKVINVQLYTSRCREYQKRILATEVRHKCCRFRRHSGIMRKDSSNFARCKFIKSSSRGRYVFKKRGKKFIEKLIKEFIKKLNSSSFLADEPEATAS